MNLKLRNGNIFVRNSRQSFLSPLLNFPAGHPRGLLTKVSETETQSSNLPSTDDPSFIHLSSNIDEVMAGENVSYESAQI